MIPEIWPGGRALARFSLGVSRFPVVHVENRGSRAVFVDHEDDRQVFVGELEIGRRSVGSTFDGSMGVTLPDSRSWRTSRRSSWFWSVRSSKANRPSSGPDAVERPTRVGFWDHRGAESIRFGLAGRDVDDVDVRLVDRDVFQRGDLGFVGRPVGDGPLAGDFLE